MPGTEIDKKLNIASRNCFSKSVPSAFPNTELIKYLKEEKVEELYVVGLDGQFCVNETVKDAINQKYTVNLIKDAILFKNLKRIGANII